MSLNPGTKLGPYEILAPLGAGGMGEVYKAKDLKLGRDVAIKVLREDLASDPERLRRFEQEARAASSLNHPNIVTIYYIGEHEGTRYIAMEYVEGKTLRELLSGEPFPNKKLLQLSTQIADGLGKAHSAGIVHRDLKPENLMVTGDGFVKILDFGLAKLMPEPSEVDSDVATIAKETREGTILGTVQYMSPEQAAGRPVDYHSDQFSFGSILYEMATGKQAFSRETVTETLAAVMRDEPEPVGNLNPTLPAPLKWIIERCIAKEGQERYGTTRDLAHELQNLRDHLADVTSAPSVLPEPQAIGRSKRTMTLFWVGALVVILALIVGLNVGGLRERMFGGAAPTRIESIAVLPLENLSGDPEQEYFVDGMTEALITNLSKIGALKVISRTSAMRYRGSDKPLPDIARELGVDAVVEGSVLRVGDRVRITAQLIEAATDQHLWAESYERELRDVLALQSEVARSIAKEIQVKLTPQEEERLATARPVDPEAHEAYLRGRYSWNKHGEEDLKKAVDYFERAIDKDPNYAMAYSGLADTYAMLGYWGMIPPREAGPKARTAALRALDLDDTLAEAHTSLGFVRFHYDWDWLTAGAELQRAIELNPNYALAHEWYASYLAAMGQVEEALDQQKQAKQLDPFSVKIAGGLAWHFILSRQYDRAIEQSWKILELDPNSSLMHGNLAHALLVKGLEEESFAQFRQMFALLGDNELVEAVDRGYAESGPRGGFLSWAETWAAQFPRKYVPPTDIAWLYAAYGINEEAFHWLERAYEERDPRLVHLAVDPVYDILSSDPRFQDLLRRMNFPD